MTKKEKARIDAFRHIGCIISRSPSYDVHHVVEGGRRLGHLYTMPLHPWFHRGVNFDGMRPSQCEQQFGPSYALSPDAFEKRYGTQRELLEKTNKLLERFL